MKQISINLYGIEELSEQAREKAFEKYRDSNVEYVDWYDWTCDDFIIICGTIGITIPEDDIVFSGFYSQGDGSAFTSTIDAGKFIDGVTMQAWKAYAPNLQFDFTSCPCNQRVLKLIRNGRITGDLKTKTPKRRYWIEYTSEYSVWDSWPKEYPHIESELEKLDKWIEDCLDILNSHLYRSLQEEYEYRTSDEALKEAFTANDYLFTADGTKANKLLQFEIN